MYRYFNPSSYLIDLALKKIIEGISGSDSETSTSELNEEAVRSEIKAKAFMAQAKVEQELAISRRIESAEEVEIEEYYDYSGKGAAGIAGNLDSVSLGLSGEGRRVSKRVIKFKGCAPISQFFPDEPPVNEV